MKKVILILMLCGIYAPTLQGQSIPFLLEKADELFEADRYLDAIEFYDKIVGLDKQNHFARYRLGYCYNQTLQYEKAKDVFLQLGRESDHEFRARAFYNYANVLKLESQFEKADSIFTFLISLPDVDQGLIDLARKQREGCLLALRQEKVDRGYVVNSMDDLNSKYHDFGAVLNPVNDHIVFATTRNLPGIQYEGKQYIGLLPDLAVFERTGNDKWRIAGSHQNFSRLNTQWSEGSGSFTSDGETFYFSSCRDEKGTNCAIMVSYLEQSNWTDPVPLNSYINIDSAENKHPFISQTGDTLFFVSDRPGGIGGSDVWMSLKGLQKESWTPAINMGAVINSSENEITPYFSSAFGCLIFASNGHVGYGGYDLYAAKGESFFEPEIYNLGYPFNSTLDDTYFSISKKSGFLASNREDSRILNLFTFPVINERLFLSLLISGESLIDSRIISKFRDIRSLDLITFRVEDYQGYDLFEPVKREKPKPEIIQGEEEGSTIIAGGTSLRDGDVLYEKLYFSYSSSDLRPEVKISLQDLANQLDGQQYSSIQVLAFTDSLGHHEYNENLSHKRGGAVKDYLVDLGINASAINVLPRGELKPHGKRDNWYSRVFNRRVEIVVNAPNPIELRSAEALLIRKEMDLKEISGRLNVEEKEMERWNGKRKSALEPGYVVRVFRDQDLLPDIRYFVQEYDSKHNLFMYRVKQGETLQSIAAKYNSMEELLAEINDIEGEPSPGSRILIYALSF